MQPLISLPVHAGFRAPYQQIDQQGKAGAQWVPASVGRAKVAGFIVEKSARGNHGDFSIADRIIASWKENRANGYKMDS